MFVVFFSNKHKCICVHPLYSIAIYEFLCTNIIYFSIKITLMEVVEMAHDEQAKYLKELITA